MKQTGEILKKIREEKGISIEEVVLATKIKSSTLRAIETGDLKNLPSKTFIRGFVQSYARYLKADEDAILESFLFEMGSTIDIPKHSDEELAEDSSAIQFVNNNRHPLFKIIVVVVTLLLLLAIYFLSKTIDKYQQEKQLVESTQKEAQTIEPIEKDAEAGKNSEGQNDPLESATQSTEVLETTEEPPTNSQEAPPKDPVVEKSSSHLKSESPIEKHEPTSKPEPIKTEQTEKQIEKPAIKDTKVDPVPQNTVKEEKKAPELEPKKEMRPAVATFIPQEIIIEALDTVNVEFKTDESSWVKISLKPEQIHTIKARNEIRVRLSDGGAVNIIHNGKDRGVPGTLGSKVEVKFP